jgi:hypothetical protein
VGQAPSRVQTDGEELLQNCREQNRVSVVEESVQSSARPGLTPERILAECAAEDAPETLGAHGLFVILPTACRAPERIQQGVGWGDVVAQKRLVLAFGVHCAAPKGLSHAGLAGNTSETGLKDSQMMSATPCLAASRKRWLWIDALKLVMTIAATSSSGNFRSPSSVRQLNCPSWQDSEQLGESMLTMW